MSTLSVGSTRTGNNEPVETNTLTFHPDFSLPENLAILRTSDGQNFRFSVPLLAQLSSFFANIIQLNLKLDKSEVIQLPSATSSGLHIVLCLLSNSISTNMRQKPLPNGSVILKHLAEVLKIIDVYDLPLVRPLLAKSASEIFHDEPGSVFTVAAVLGEEKMAVNITKSHPSLRIDSTCRGLLYTFVPTFLCRIQEFQSHNREEDNKLGKLIKRSASVPGGPANDFINACKKRGGCATFVEYDGEFDHMRTRVTDTCYQIVTGSAELLGAQAGNLADVIVHSLVDCERCAQRMKGLFRRLRGDWVEQRKISI